MTKPFYASGKIFVIVKDEWYEFPTWDEAYDFYYENV